MCVALPMCLSNTRHNASKKLLAKQQVDEKGKSKRERMGERGGERGVACLGALENNLNCHCKVGSAQRFAAGEVLKKFALCLCSAGAAAAFAAITLPAYCYFRKQ